MQYPPPSNALTIWLADGAIRVAIPPAPGSSRGHCITVDPDVDGLKTILHFLKMRLVARDQRLGSPGVPTQAMAEALQSSIKVTTVVKTTVKKDDGSLNPPALSLEDLGL